MKGLFELGNQYAKESDWKDFALVKVFKIMMRGITKSSGTLAES